MAWAGQSVMRYLASLPKGATTAFARIPQTYDATGASVPAPIEGWDAVSPISAMSPKRAIRLINWFPQPDWVEPRKGFSRHSDTGTGEPVETLAAYHGLTEDKLFAWSDGSIFDVTSRSDALITTVTGLTNSRAQFVNFATTGGNFLWTCNGADAPNYYNGTTWAQPTITGDIASDEIVDVEAFKNRLWFVGNNSSDAYYLPVDSIQGAATVYPLGGIWTLGGYLTSIGTWSVDAGNGPQDYIAFVSSRGQVAIYGGSDPADPTDFNLVGVFSLGAPVGRRCLTRVGSDLAVISIDGVYPLSKAMIFERAAVVKATMTERIQRVMNQSARLYQDHFGWQLISYPRGTRAILNVPISEGVEQQQYVMNTLNGAWCQFTGMNANCWELLLDDPYFGGNDGIVYQADVGSQDHNQILRADMMTAFNYFNMRGNQKRWTMCRPLITTDQQVTPGLALNVDYKNDAPISVQSTTEAIGAKWDESLWDDSEWGGEITTQSIWQSISGIGYCASIRMVVDINPSPLQDALWGEALWGISLWGGEVPGAGLTLQVNSFDILMEKGAFV